MFNGQFRHIHVKHALQSPSFCPWGLFRHLFVAAAALFSQIVAARLKLFFAGLFDLGGKSIKDSPQEGARVKLLKFIKGSVKK